MKALPITHLEQTVVPVDEQVDHRGRVALSLDGAVVASAVLTDVQPIGHLHPFDFGTERRPIPGWPGYLATLTGEIYTDAEHRFAGKVLQPRIDREGYPSLLLNASGTRKPVRVHQLVAEAWLTPVPWATVVRHADGDRTNNAAWNLRRGTHGDNLRDAYAMGERHSGARGMLTIEQAEQIRGRLAAGENRRVLADAYGVPVRTIGKIDRGESYVERTPPDDSVARRRWALLLDDIKPTTERCPWCWGDGEDLVTYDQPCRVCSPDPLDELGPGYCGPVPARGQQAVP